MIDKKVIKKFLDDALIDAYKIMLKEDSTSQDFINIFWHLLGDVYGYILGYIRKKIPEAKDIHLDIKDLLYDDLDEDRIKTYFKDFKKQSNQLEARTKFLHQLSKIFTTEVGLVKDRTFQAIGNQLATERQDSDTIYYYEVWLCIDESFCGEVGGEEMIEEKYSWIPLEQDTSEMEICGHPNCPGHDVDIEYRLVGKMKKGEFEI